jgi:hypothetical protein
METNSHQEPVGLCLILHWAHTNSIKGSSCISNGLKTAIGIGFGSGGFEEDHSQTFDKLQHKINVAWRQTAIRNLLDCV